MRAARRAQGDETGRAGASGAASILGHVERVGAGARVWRVGAQEAARGQGAGRRRKKGEGKRKREKEKEKREEEEKGEKEKEAPAGFAALVASRASRRIEATCTRNEE